MRPPDARYLPALVLCVAAAVARLTVGPHIADDAYITMRYSRNLATAGAMSYNVPDAVLGTSTPLWTWILAGGDIAGVAPETTAFVVSLAADLCSIVLILRSPAGVTLGAIVAAATIAAWPAYVTYAVSGMETSLYVLIVVAFVTALSRHQIARSAASASAGALCRPDGALLVVLGFAWTFFTGSGKAAWRSAAIAAALCAPWAAYAFARFGSIVPASVRAKASATDPWFLSFQNVQAYFFHGIYIPITVLALVGFVLIVGKSAFWRVWSLWGWSYLAAMTAANGFTHFPWYFVPLLPIYSAAAGTALERVWHLSRKGDWHRLWKSGWHGWPESTGRDAVFATPAARTAIAAIVAVVLLSRMPALKAYLDSTEIGREKLYASVATELAGVDARCTVAATEIGTIGYHYPGRVLDLAGLVSPEVIGRPVQDVLTESRARWLVTYDTHFDRAVAGSEAFSNLFERRSSVRINDARTLEVYERRDRAGCDRR